AVDRDAGEQGILRRGEPVGERFDAAVAEVDLRRREGPAGGHLVVLLRALGVAAAEDVALFQRTGRVHFDRPEDGDGRGAAPAASTAAGAELALELVVLLAQLRRHDLRELVAVDA